jgi:hypothetical protein
MKVRGSRTEKTSEVSETDTESTGWPAQPNEDESEERKGTDLERWVQVDGVTASALQMPAEDSNGQDRITETDKSRETPIWLKKGVLSILLSQRHTSAVLMNANRTDLSHLTASRQCRGTSVLHSGVI